MSDRAAAGGVPSEAEPLVFRYLGLKDEPSLRVDYREVWQLQHDLHARVAAGEIGPQVLFVEHQSVYTAGRQTRDEERPFDGTPVIDVDRGGKITWHGPGQLVCYPIIKLPDSVGVVDHVRRVEQAVIDVLASYGIAAGRVPGRTGVWLPADDPSSVPEVVHTGPHHAASTERTGNFVPGVVDMGTRSAGGLRGGVPPASAEDPVLDPSGRGSFGGARSAGGLRGVVPPVSGRNRPERKICAIGIRVSKRTSLHGFALNVNDSLERFGNIVPCGISDAGVTSMARELDGPAPSLLEVAARLEPLLSTHLSREGTLSL